MQKRLDAYEKHNRLGTHPVLCSDAKQLLKLSVDVEITKKEQSCTNDRAAQKWELIALDIVDS